MAQLTPTVFDKNTDLTRGELSYIYILDMPFAYLKSDDLKFTPSQIDVASKLSGKFDDKMGGKTEWSISCEGMTSSTRGHMSIEALLNIAGSGKAVPMEIKKVKLVDENGKRKHQEATTWLKGSVTVSDVSRKSSNGEYDTVTATLTGSGALFDASGNEIGSDTALKALGITIA